MNTSRLLEIRWAAAAMFGTLVSAFIALAYWLMRVGLTTPSALAPAAVVIVAGGAFGPLLLPRAGFFANVGMRAVAYPLVSFAIFASVLLAFASGPALMLLYPFLALAGMVRAWHIVRPSVREILTSGVLLVIGAGAVAAYLFIHVNNLGLAGVYTPESGMLGVLNHDTRFQSAIAYLIQHFGVPSLGVDGMLPLHYHYGSHLWFAALGTLTGAEPMWSYGAGVLIFSVPVLLLALLFSAIAVDHGAKTIRNYLIIALFLLFLSDTIGWNSYYVSETYTFGLIGMLLFMPLLARLVQDDNGVTFRWIALLLGVAAIPLLMSLKVSVGVLWGAALVYASFRRFGMGMLLAGVAIGALCALTIGMKAFGPGPGDYVYTNGQPIALFYLLRVYPEGQTFSSFILPLSLLLVSMATYKTTLRQMILSKQDILVEVCVVATLLGALPAFLGIPQDSAVWYFLNVGQWFALSVLVSRLSLDDFRGAIAHIRGLKLGGAIVAVMAFVLLSKLIESVTPNNLNATLAEIVRTANQQGGDFLHGRSVTRYVVDTLKSEHRIFGWDFQSALERSIGARVIADVKAANRSGRPDFAVFIPPSNEAYWRFQASCRDKHNIQVALTGYPSIFGAPPQSYSCDRDAYQTNYGAGTDSHEASDEELCIHARSRKISEVYILADLDKPEANRILNCAQSGKMVH